MSDIGPVTLRQQTCCWAVLTSLAEMGAVVLPPVPAFYHKPKGLDDVINHTVARVLDRLSLPHTLADEWKGTTPKRMQRDDA
jgi:3-polyprenyl-4-hydroxybenzoate decarboxylase